MVVAGATAVGGEGGASPQPVLLTTCTLDTSDIDDCNLD